MTGRHRVDRVFVSVGEREVHCRMVGAGPPALFIHSSPTNSGFVVDDMIAQADRHRCYAFDTPGFGLSDPLPLADLTVADLAHAMAATMDVVGLPPLPVFGTHSGAAIALELAYRHPDKVTGIVLDGVPIFTRAEVAQFATAQYFAPLEVDPLGGHYAASWTRFRDQSIWFPWYVRHPSQINEYDLADPASIHLWTLMFYAAAAHYKPAYRAAISYCEDALTAVAGLTVPAIFTAGATDMLLPHLQRLPPLRDDQQIVAAGPDRARRFALTGEGFARFGGSGVAPQVPAGMNDSGFVRRQFIMDDGRAQLIRAIGARRRPALLLLHDAPGSGRMVEARMRVLAPDHYVIAPDLPGSGESEPLEEAADMVDYAGAIWRLCDAIGIDDVAIEGHGFGASLAVEMGAAAPDRCRAIAIDGLLLPDAAERAELAARYAPPITIERDGAHWYRLWLGLRDGLIYWPWYDTRKVALRRVATDFDAALLHDRTVETMKQHASYHRFIAAALRQDVAARLAACPVAVTRLPDPLAALGAAYGDRLDEILAARAG